MHKTAVTCSWELQSRKFPQFASNLTRYFKRSLDSGMLKLVNIFSQHTRRFARMKMWTNTNMPRTWGRKSAFPVQRLEAQCRKHCKERNVTKLEAKQWILLRIMIINKPKSIRTGWKWDQQLCRTWGAKPFDACLSGPRVAGKIKQTHTKHERIVKYAPTLGDVILEMLVKTNPPVKHLEPKLQT